jgi:Smg protein
MKQHMMDVLVYVFENYMTEHYNLKETGHRQQIISGLQKIGFSPGLIEDAIVWLQQVSQKPDNLIQQSQNAVRHFSHKEQQILGVDGIDFIEYLMAQGILSNQSRELLIDGLLYLKADNIEVDDLQWLALIILFSQPDQEQAFVDLERLLFDSAEICEH